MRKNQPNMPQQFILQLSQKFQLNEFIIASWIETANLKTPKKAEAFFVEHIEAIKAQPLVKWV